jgi:hypothetical protein
MDGNRQARRAPKLSNWMIAVGLAAVALAAYALIAVRIHEHGIGG